MNIEKQIVPFSNPRLESKVNSCYLPRRRYLSCLSVAIFACIIYWEAHSYNSFKNGFHMDDVVAIQKNLDVVNPSWTDWRSFLRHDFWGLDMFSGEWTHKSFRPVTTLTYRWNWLMSGLDTCAFHVTNIVVHGIVSGLVVFVGEVFGFSLPDSMMAGVLFAVHPVHTESVLYLVGRADTLCAVLMLCGFILYEKNKICSSYFIVILSGLAKEIGFMAFPVMATMDLVRAPKSHKIWMTLLVGAMCMCMRHWYTDGTHLKMSPQDNPIAFEGEDTARVLSYALVHSEYFRLLIYPMFLCYDYSMNTIPLVCDFSDFRILAPFSAYLIFTCIAKKKFQRSSGGVLPLSLFVFSFVPMSNIFFPVGTVVGERLLYIPSIGFVFILVQTMPRRVVVLMAIFWSIRTVNRISDWKTANHLTIVDGLVNPRSSKTMYNLGVQHFTKQRYDEAYQALSLSIAADELKRDGIAFWRLGQIELMRGNVVHAEELLVAATTKYGAKLMVREEEIFHDAGLACYHNGKIEKANYYLSAALSLNRIFPKALNNMACLQATSLGNTQAALSLLFEATKLKPKNVIYSGNVWIVGSISNRPDIAAWGRNRTLTIQPSFVPGKACIWEFKPAEGGPGDTALNDD